MGKKKDKHRHREHDAGHGGGKGAGAFAGIAAMALHQVKNQLDSPAGRQAMATGLRAAADALAPKPPRAPEPPAPPAPDAYAANPAEPPRDPSPPPRPEVPPEVARVIGSVAAGLEKWAAKFGVPKG